jgi:beta-phosphoglucomutase-like phosphatase (HAD superfamily)
LIFDFNGVLVDDGPRQCALVREILSQEGIALSEPQSAERYLGFDDRRCFAAALSDAGREADQDLVEDRVARYAKAAGIWAVGVAHTFAPRRLRHAGADIISPAWRT